MGDNDAHKRTRHGQDGFLGKGTPDAENALELLPRPPVLEPFELEAIPSELPLSIDAAAELGRYVEEALTRFATPGRVLVERGELILDGPMGRASTPLGPSSARWNLLDEGSRRARALDLARQLAKQHHSAARSERPGREWPRHLLGWTALGLSLMTGYLVYGLFKSDRAPTAPEVPPVERKGSSPVVTADARSEQICETTRARVVRGATVSVADADGWVVELRATRVGAALPLDLERMLGPFLENPTDAAGSRFLWSEQPHFVPLHGENSRVFVQAERAEDAGIPLDTVRVIFSGVLVDGYFRPEERARYFHVATAMSTALDATHAALVARCAHQSTYHLGSWFYGRTDAEAAAALLESLGLHSDSPHLAAPFLHPEGTTQLDRVFAFRNIRAATHDLDRPALASTLGTNQGMAMGKSGESVLITFQFQDGSSASRASRKLARLVGIGAP